MPGFFFKIDKNSVILRLVIQTNHTNSEFQMLLLKKNDKNSNNQKSGLNIDKDSCVCDACNYNETKKKIDWEKREKELVNLLEKYRKPSGYDCVVPGSGGKDSAYTAHILKYKYGTVSYTHLTLPTKA